MTTPTIIELATACASALAIQLPDVDVRVAFAPVYDSTKTKALRAYVIPESNAVEVVARDAFVERPAVQIVLCQYLGRDDVGAVAECVGILEDVARLFLKFQVETVDRRFTTKEVEVDTIFDASQLEENYVYNGAVSVVFQSAALFKSNRRADGPPSSTSQDDFSQEEQPE